MQREILIQASDGQSKTYQLTGDRVTLGRSSTTELCFADDAGLSRQHMALERDGEEWTVQDLGSKNGTQVNNIPLKGKLKLKSGDRITAGHLVIVYDDRAATPAAAAAAAGAVVFYETARAESPSTSTVVTSLEGALSDQTIVRQRHRRSRRRAGQSPDPRRPGTGRQHAAGRAVQEDPGAVHRSGGRAARRADDARRRPAGGAGE